MYASMGTDSWNLELAHRANLRLAGLQQRREQRVDGDVGRSGGGQRSEECLQRLQGGALQQRALHQDQRCWQYLQGLGFLGFRVYT